MELSSNGLFLNTKVLEMRNNGVKGQSIKIETPAPMEPFISKAFYPIGNLITGLPTGCGLKPNSLVTISNRGEISRDTTPDCGGCKLRCNSAYPEEQLKKIIEKRQNK